MNNHLVDSSIVKDVLVSPDPDSHKGQNGKILIIGGSALFHGAAMLSVKATYETLVSIASKVNDMVYFCSNQDNLDFLKQRQESFIGITREQLDDYLPNVDVVLSGPGLMRESEPNMPQTIDEPKQTLELTKKVISSGKRAVLDAGSIQVIQQEDLAGKEKIIITPHRHEMANLFNITPEKLTISHDSSFEEIEVLGLFVQEFAKKLGITILLKGPVDIIADSNNWAYSRGGNAGMTKGGSGDVLAGIVAAFYTKSTDPFLVASFGSFLTKKIGEKLHEKQKWLYNSSDLVKNITETLTELIKENDGQDKSKA